MAKKLTQLEVLDHTAERSFDELPFCYRDPNDINIFWVCNYDQDQKITSVVVKSNEEKGRDRVICYLDSLEKAIEVRNGLIKSGWVEFSLPQITVSQERSTNSTNSISSLTRKQRRYLERQNRKKK